MRDGRKQMITSIATKRIVVTAVFAVAAAASALASDLPPPAAPAPRAPAVYLPPAPVYNWGGIYFGINGGWGFGKTDWLVPGATTGNFNVSGGLVGATLGANWQSGGFVWGLEGDFDGSWIDGKNSSVCGVPNCETKNTWLSTVRARFGFAADRVLFYGTAGGAFGNIVANVAPTFQSTSRAGWTAGAGIEGAFTNNLTARVEYLFVDLSSASFNSAPGVSVKLNNLSLIRVGLDYKFNVW
jgi:outer membrane immunogenic protein